MRERIELLGDIVHHLTDNLVYLHLFHGGSAMAISNRLLHVTAARNTSNSYEWDVRWSVLGVAVQFAPPES